MVQVQVPAIEADAKLSELIDTMREADRSAVVVRPPGGAEPTVIELDQVIAGLNAYGDIAGSELLERTGRSAGEARINPLRSVLPRDAAGMRGLHGAEERAGLGAGSRITQGPDRASATVDLRPDVALRASHATVVCTCAQGHVFRAGDVLVAGRCNLDGTALTCR